MKVWNVSEGIGNYSQRNNRISPNSSCGPTNMIQALEYAGWQWDNSMFPELNQPEDKLTKFCRTNKNVLSYYQKHYKNMYDNWRAEAEKLAKAQKRKYWEVDCPVSYPPNEVHDVMSYAVNLFIGYSPKELGRMKRRPVTRFYNEFDEFELIWQICKGLPVVSSVDPFKAGGGHYVTIVGFEADNGFNPPKSYEERESINLGLVKSYIIDNTYGKFDFKNKRYEVVSGNDERIERDKFLSIIKPVAHYFTKGAAVCC